MTLRDELVCLDLASGERRWTVPSGAVNNDWRITSSPAASGARIFFGALDGTVRSVEADSGRVLWTIDTGSQITTSLTVVEDDLYLGTYLGRVLHLDGLTGAVLAEAHTSSVPSRKPAFLDGRLLIFLTTEGEGAALKAFGPALGELWAQDDGGGWSSARPHVWRDLAVVGTENGDVVGLRMTDGARVWSTNVKGSVAGIGSDADALYIGTVNGTVFAYRPHL